MLPNFLGNYGSGIYYLLFFKQVELDYDHDTHTFGCRVTGCPCTDIQPHNITDHFCFTCNHEIKDEPDYDESAEE